MFIHFWFPLFFAGFLSCNRHPVLLVPGLGASQIYGEFFEHPNRYTCNELNKTFSGWLNPKFMLPFLVECTISLLKLEYNTSTRVTSSPKYCKTEIPGFGKVDTIDYISENKYSFTAYFARLIENLVKKHKYTRNIDIRGAPYDFRKGPDESKEFLGNVKQLIEDMFHQNNNTSVLIIAHSLGNLHILRLLNTMSQNWKDKYIRVFISVSAPYAGSVVAMESILSGFRSADIILNSLNLRRMESTWPSLYYLFPNPLMWPEKPVILTRDANFTTKDFRKLLAISKVPNAQDHFDDIKKNFAEVKPPRVEVFCLFSTDLETPDILDYRSVNFPDHAPKIIYINGDSTVPLNSLMICPQWKTEQKEKVTLVTISKIRHINMVRDPKPISVIEQIISNINS